MAAQRKNAAEDAPAAPIRVKSKYPPKKKPSKWSGYVKWGVAIGSIVGLFVYFEMTGKREGGWGRTSSDEMMPDMDYSGRILREKHEETIAELSAFRTSPQGKEFSSQWMEMDPSEREELMYMARTSVASYPIFAEMPGLTENKGQMLVSLVPEVFAEEFREKLATENALLIELMHQVLIRQENHIIMEEIAEYERMAAEEGEGEDRMDGVGEVGPTGRQRTHGRSEIQESMMMFRSLLMSRFFTDVVEHWVAINQSGW